MNKYEKTFCSPKFCPKAMRNICSRWMGNFKPPHSYEIRTIEIHVTDFSQDEHGNKFGKGEECNWFALAQYRRHIDDKPVEGQAAAC